MSGEANQETTDLAAMVKADREKRVAACLAEAGEALRAIGRKHRCSILPMVRIVGTGIAEAGLSATALES